MVAFAKPPYVSPEEYLEWERNAEFRSEYYGGTVVAMSGGSIRHSVIIANIARHVGNKLEGEPCETVSQGLKLWIAECERYYYPDVMVYYGKPQLQDKKQDVILNALVVFEVLSPSTQHIDKGEKLHCYQECETLADYVIVAQDRSFVEHYARQNDGSWRYLKLSHLNDILRLSGVACELTLTEIYARVSFDSEQLEDEDNAL